ncbi:HEXXH motif-containing putative peptide modification protein [Plantactinospora sp. B6F1]
MATPVGTHLLIDPSADEMLETEISDTPICLLGPDTQPPSGPARDLVVEAVRVGAEAGFGTLLHGSAPVIVLLARRSLGEVLTSWSITRLPGTIFVDHVDDPTVLARDIIHEAGHNWLNGALATYEIKIPESVTFHSPWKRKHRPAFGFIHACWAFPLTVIFADRVLCQVQGAVAAYLAAYLDKQRPLLAAAEDDHSRALDLIDEPDLRSRLADVFAAARAL